jgi:inosine-uridine nucleoside N-ribohydrolase
VVPVDPSTATQLSKGLLDRMAKVASSDLAQFIGRMEPGFPLWDEIAAGVWLDPTLIKTQDMLFVDYNTQFGPSYGDTLSWRAGYQPGVGEQSAVVVREIYPARLEDMMVKLVAKRSR